MSKPAFFALVGIVVIVIAYLECMASQLPTAPPSQRKAPSTALVAPPGSWKQEFGRPRDYSFAMHRNVRAFASR